MNDKFIVCKIAECQSADERTILECQVDTETCESKLIIRKTISEQMPVNEINEARALFKKLTEGNGRRLYRLKDLV